MPKEGMQLEDVAHAQLVGPLDCRSPGDRGFVREVIVPGKASTSVASPECFRTRLRATGFPANVQENSGSPMHSEGRSPESKNPAQRIPGSFLETCSIVECKNLLHQHALDLLETAGWIIRKQKRPSRKSKDYKFTSPGGRSVRELCRAWRLCGEMLISGGSTMAQVEDVKEWDCFSMFLSDVKCVLARLVTEFTALASSNALVHRWVLLDPFISVFFIEKKIGALRKGEVVKVSRSYAPGNEENATSDWKDKFQNRDPFRRRNVSVSSCNSSKNRKSESKVVALCAERRNRGSGRRSCDFRSGLDIFEIRPVERRVISLQCSSKETLPHNEALLAQLGEGDARDVEETSIVTWDIGDGLIKERDAENIGKLPVGVNQCTRLCSSLFQSDPSSCKLQYERSKSAHSKSKSGNHTVSCSGTSRVLEQFEHDKSRYILCSIEDGFLRKKIKMKSKRISRIDSATFRDDGLFRQCYLPSVEALDFGTNGSLDHSDGCNVFKGTRKSPNNGEKSQPIALFYLNDIKKREHEKGSGDSISFEIRTKRSRKCNTGDDDIPVPIVVQNNKVSPLVSHPTPRRKANKLKTQSNGWRLLHQSCGNARKLLMKKEWSLLGARTVLSWLINAGVIFPNDVIQYRDLEDNSILKDGLITWDGIICKCCGQVLSVSQFKIHSGFKSNHICLNLFMKESGPFSLCSLEAWSSEYKMRKNAGVAVQADESDHNDYLCAVCGDAGELICCDHCPATYHQSCLLTKDLSEGDWYCPSCRCWICQELVDDQNPMSSSDTMKCLQCEHKYHESCLKRRNGNEDALDGCFCGESCQQVHFVLRSRIGLMNRIVDGYSWILLRCFHDDLKFPSAAKFAFKAECNSKVAVALSLMEECFVSMVDPLTGIDMIPHLLYNLGSNFARLNFDNFYTVVLENDDVLIAAACIRVHGVAIAEMPLIATCSKYRRQGMCRRLMTAVEELLLAIKVEKLVIAALPELVDIWTKCFEFQILEDDEKQALRGINLMVFPGTVLLKKSLYTKPVVPSAVICCGLLAGGRKAGGAAEICCALEAERASATKL